MCNGLSQQRLLIIRPSITYKTYMYQVGHVAQGVLALHGSRIPRASDLSPRLSRTVGVVHMCAASNKDLNTHIHICICTTPRKRLSVKPLLLHDSTSTIHNQYVAMVPYAIWNPDCGVRLALVWSFRPVETSLSWRSDQ